MESLSVMSRAELVCELLAPPQPMSVTDASSAYLSRDGAPTLVPCDAIVGFKLAVAREIILRDLIAQLRAGPALSSPDAVRTWLKLRCAGLDHEVFIVLYLDVRNRLIQDEEAFRGTLTHTSVYPREVVKSALAHNAASVILAHNHPSGDPEPSNADRNLTTQLAAALAMVEVRVIDHFIASGDRVVSFAEKGLL